MQLATIQPNTVKTGTCPHGLPLGACPICNGMSGGGSAKKADSSAKSGEMSWNECAAIGAFLKAQQNAKTLKNNDFQNFAQNVQAFQKALSNASQKITNITQFFNDNTPALIAKPINFVLNKLVIGTLNILKNIPTTIANIIQTVQQKLTDISDKLTAIMGELKAAVDKKIADAFKTIKKKFKSLSAIFKPINSDNDNKEVDETKKTFELKTFLHDLYKKLMDDEKKNNQKG